jgi:CubicO group peptidase (beta-lactamase class C family)
MLAQDRKLDLGAPIADVWREFAQNGKGTITLRDVLGHRGGIPVLDGNFTLDDLMDVDILDRAIERQTPIYQPGSKHGYHAVTYGWIIDGVVRRVMGRSVSSLVQTKIAKPLGLDLRIGTPKSMHKRVEPVIQPPPMDIKIKDLKPLLNPKVFAMTAKVLREMRNPNSVANRGVYINGAFTDQDWNDPRIWAAQWPAATCITNARSLARMYAACVGEVDGVRLLTPETVETARTEVSFGNDATSVFPSRFGHGFHLHHDFAPLLTETSFGHGGMGGSQAFADPTHNVGFAYVMNQMQTISQRASSLVDALRTCL